MTAPVRIGVLGLASIALRRMIPAIAAFPGTELVAVASRDRDRAREAAGTLGCRAAADYEALLAMEDVEAVYVPLPAALHATWNEAALAAGKHVLAEKPLSLEPARTRALLASARARRLVLMENVMFVHHRQHAEVARLLREGAIGAPRALQATFTIPRLPDDDIRHSAGLGGGALADVGLYPLRAALHLLGPGLDVAGATLTHGAGREVETAGAALLHGPGGVSVQLAFGMDHGYRSSYEVWGSGGRIAVDRAFTPPADHVPVLRVERGTSTEELRLPCDDQVANTVAAFAAAVRDPAAGAAVTDDPAALRQAELLDGIRRSAVVHHESRPDPHESRSVHDENRTAHRESREEVRSV